MKILLILTILIFSAPVLSKEQDILPVAIAKFCVNKVVHKQQLKFYQNQVLTEGCSEVKTVYLHDGFYLVYGVKVLTGENYE